MPLGGGVLIALCLLAGGVVGARYREPSLGVIVGLGVGVLLAVLFLWWDRSRNRKG